MEFRRNNHLAKHCCYWWISRGIVLYQVHQSKFLVVVTFLCLKYFKTIIKPFNAIIYSFLEKIKMQQYQILIQRFHYPIVCRQDFSQLTVSCDSNIQEQMIFILFYFRAIITVPNMKNVVLVPTQNVKHMPGWLTSSHKVIWESLKGVKLMITKHCT